MRNARIASPCVVDAIPNLLTLADQTFSRRISRCGPDVQMITSQSARALLFWVDAYWGLSTGSSATRARPRGRNGLHIDPKLAQSIEVRSISFISSERIRRHANARSALSKQPAWRKPPVAGGKLGYWSEFLCGSPPRSRGDSWGRG